MIALYPCCPHPLLVIIFVLVDDDGDGDVNGDDDGGDDGDDDNTGCFFSLGLPLKSFSMGNQG